MSLLTKDMHKSDIEKFLEGKGDFVKIDYLTRYIKIMPPIEMRKFAYLKLAEIYMGKEMYVDAAMAFKNAGVNSVSFKEKQENFLDEARAYISGGKFDDADKALRRAMDEGNQKEKEDLYKGILNCYKTEAEKLEKMGKHGSLVKLYEKMLRLKFSDAEHAGVKENLLKLYEKLGKVKEYKILRDVGRI